MPHFTTYDGTELAYRVTGEGEPLVCLAGGPPRDADHLGGLSAHRTLVLLDAPGTGASADPGQKCGPHPNATWSLMFSRSALNCSGQPKRCSS